MTSPGTLVFDVAKMRVGAHFLYTLGIKQSPRVAQKCDSEPEIDQPKKKGAPQTRSTIASSRLGCVSLAVFFLWEERPRATHPPPLSSFLFCPRPAHPPTPLPKEEKYCRLCRLRDSWSMVPILLTASLSAPFLKPPEVQHHDEGVFPAVDGAAAYASYVQNASSEIS